MLRSTETTGKTVDEAISVALSTLCLTKEEVEVSVLEGSSKGILGLGSKEAKVLVAEKPNAVARAYAFMNGLLKTLHMEALVHVAELEGNAIKVRVEGNGMSMFIGHRGETLDALQYLLSLAVNRGGLFEYVRVILDTENYRAKREETLIQLADRLAYKAQETGRPVVLEPMTPYERRIMHSALQNHPHVVTHSEGEDPRRRVVITLK